MKHSSKRNSHIDTNSNGESEDLQEKSKTSSEEILFDELSSDASSSDGSQDST